MQRLPLRMFSSGMLMRVLFATATAFPADILLLDEWLSVVDENFSAKAEQRLLKLVESAAIVIIASHDQRAVAPHLQHHHQPRPRPHRQHDPCSTAPAEHQLNLREKRA